MNFDYAAAVVAPFRMQPGLRRMEPSARHFTPLVPGGRHQREKLAVLSAFASQALVGMPSFDARPALARVCEQAAREHPEAFAWDGHTATSLTLGVAVRQEQVLEIGAGAFGLGDELGRCLTGLPPQWRMAGLLALSFAQDLAVVQGDTGQVPWMAVALPSHWDPTTKVGRHFNEIHAPVADPQLLLAAGQRLMKLVCGPESFERFVWNITGHPRLHAHPDRVDPVRWPQSEGTDFARQAWWRTERQTFLPMPDAGLAVFTIEVDVQPLGLAVSTRAQAQTLHEALGTMSEAVLEYRSLRSIRPALLRWLSLVAS
jgi:dimethylamine monooxygenase subunit A